MALRPKVRRPSTASDTQNSAEPAACDQSDAEVTEAYRTLPNIDPDLTSVDLYPVAGSCSAPVVMWVHGGGYRTGDKSNQMRDKVKLFNDQGWIVVSVNYRLTKPGQPGSAQFPDHFDDVASAVAWAHDNIASFGGDPSRIALLGHSAGADIVSNVATNPTYLQAHGLDLSVLRSRDRSTPRGSTNGRPVPTILMARRTSGVLRWATTRTT